MPKKKTEESQISEGEVQATEEEQTSVLADKAAQQRAELYASMQEEEAETSPEEEVAETPPEEGEQEEEAETSPEEEVADKTVAESEKEKPMVPLDALHEARAETKEARETVKILQQQLSQVIGDFKNLVDAKTKPSEPEVDLEAMDESEREIYLLRQEVKELKGHVVNQAQTTQQTTEAQRKEKLTGLVNSVDTELTKEGFPGFGRFQDQIAYQLVEEGIVPGNVAFTDPKEWKRVYKETVFPETKKIFINQAREEKNAEKEKLKEQANLVKTPGKKQKVKPKEKELNYKDYLEIRAKRQVL
jgi:hypothetical protein